VSAAKRPLDRADMEEIGQLAIHKTPFGQTPVAVPTYGGAPAFNLDNDSLEREAVDPPAGSAFATCFKFGDRP
jgi:hypothetical protein